MKIGIQGGKGSNNEQAMQELAQKKKLKNHEIVYLYETEKEIESLLDKTIDRGFFAKNTGSRKVAETFFSLEKHLKDKIKETDEYTYLVKHSVYARTKLQPLDYLKVHSHIQGLGVHAEFIWNKYKNISLCPELDTSVAAEKLSQKKYPVTSLVIAPQICREIYPNLIILEDWLEPHNYETTFSLVKLK